jgi:DNA-directed RNA polymerase specialized sigma54-like protein
MTHQDNLESYEATEAQDLTRLLQALRPPERAVQVPPPVDLTIRAATWQAPVRRQVSTLLSLARRDLIQVIRQALRENPWLEEVTRADDEDAPAGRDCALHLTASADELMDAEERYDSIWQACMSDGWDASGLPAPASEASGASAHASASSEGLVPDVMVVKVGQDYRVVLNKAGMPRLRLRATNRRLVREDHGGAFEATQDLDDKLRAAL